jgi:mRNA-degrading endonuclease YafQ of YafQ-DinJ toxin-antitoxin module
MVNPLKSELNNHALNWAYKWYRSINISWDFRAIFREYPNWTYEFIEFIDIWTHSQLY